MTKQIGRWLVVWAVLACGTAVAAAQAPKIAVFDPQRVSEETALGRQVQTQLKAFRDRKQGEINDRQKSIEELQKQLDQQALSLSADKRTSMEKDISRQLLELQAAKETATRQMQLEVAAAQNTFQDKLLVVVESFGKEQGFLLILDRSVSAWAAPEADVTTAIVDRFDKLFPPEKE